MHLISIETGLLQRPRHEQRTSVASGSSVCVVMAFHTTLRLSAGATSLGWEGVGRKKGGMLRWCKKAENLPTTKRLCSMCTGRMAALRCISEGACHAKTISTVLQCQQRSFGYDESASSSCTGCYSPWPRSILPSATAR
jgi:hypothetical protein